MPHISTKIIEGRDEASRQRIAEARGTAVPEIRGDKHADTARGRP